MVSSPRGSRSPRLKTWPRRDRQRRSRTQVRQETALRLSTYRTPFDLNLQRNLARSFSLAGLPDGVSDAFATPPTSRAFSVLIPQMADAATAFAGADKFDATGAIGSVRHVPVRVVTWNGPRVRVHREPAAHVRTADPEDSRHLGDRISQTNPARRVRHEVRRHEPVCGESPRQRATRALQHKLIAVGSDITREYPPGGSRDAAM